MLSFQTFATEETPSDEPEPVPVPSRAIVGADERYGKFVA